MPTKRILLALTFALGLGLLAGTVASRVGSGGSPSRSIAVSAENLDFSSQELEAPAGDVTVTLTNHDAVTHTFTIRALGFEVVAGAGELAAGTLRAGKGTYDFICTIPGHDNPGMQGRLRLR